MTSLTWAGKTAPRSVTPVALTKDLVWFSVHTAAYNSSLVLGDPTPSFGCLGHQACMWSHTYMQATFIYIIICFGFGFSRQGCIALPGCLGTHQVDKVGLKTQRSS